jgi:hypothetical protein
VENISQSDTPEPRDSVVITVSLPDASVYNSPLTLEEVANAVQQDYFNYPGAKAKAEVRERQS